MAGTEPHPWETGRMNSITYEPLGLTELAALTGLSSHHFREAFKKSIGTSPHWYAMER